MTTVDNAAAATGAAKSRRLTRWGPYSGSAFLLLMLVVGVPHYFTLPSCDATRVTDTVRRLFKEKDVELDRLTGIRQISEEKNQATCAAQTQIKGEPLNLTYRVFWDGWSKKVQISGAQKVGAASRR